MFSTVSVGDSAMSCMQVSMLSVYFVNRVVRFLFRILDWSKFFLRLEFIFFCQFRENQGKVSEVKF